MCESKLEGVDEMTKRENLGRKERGGQSRNWGKPNGQIYRVTVLRRQDRFALSVDVE